MHRRDLMISGLALLMSAAAASGAGAAEWWGKKLPGRPQNFIFGYGSLINTASRNSTASKPIDAIPVRVSASFGYVRAWVDRAKSGFTALGLRKPGAGEQATTINGVLYPVEGNDMNAFDAREAGYKRMEVPREAIESVSWEQVPTDGKIWVYVSVGKDGTPGEGLQPPSADYPVLQSYVDVVIDGALEYGPDYARELIETTADWSPYWLNDRELPRRPWVYDKNYAAVDKLLEETAPAAPHFKDRLFPEVYAVRNLAPAAQ